MLLHLLRKTVVIEHEPGAFAGGVRAGANHRTSSSTRGGWVVRLPSLLGSRSASNHAAVQPRSSSFTSRFRVRPYENRASTAGGLPRRPRAPLRVTAAKLDTGAVVSTIRHDVAGPGRRRSNGPSGGGGRSWLST
jgi:hypothetical protein